MKHYCFWVEFDLPDDVIDEWGVERERDLVYKALNDKTRQFLVVKPEEGDE